MVQTMFDSNPQQPIIEISEEDRLINTLNHARIDKRNEYQKLVKAYKIPQNVVQKMLDNPTADSWDFEITELPHIKLISGSQRGRGLFAKETPKFDYHLETLFIDKLLSLDFCVATIGETLVRISYEGDR